MQEKIWRLAVQLPECVASTPERVLLINPLTLALVLLRTPRDELTMFEI
jgi:hypothetical protein